MRFLLVSVFLSFFVLPVFGQDAETLADVRQELSVLNAEINTLKRELSTTGSGGTVVTGDTLQRIDAIEAGLVRLNAKTEQLENRINRVVADGTNRIGDLEFRLIELEGGDLGAIGETPVLGGETGGTAVIAPAEPAETDTAELAVGEKADYERAQEALASGDFRSAAEKFAAFTQTYPGGPLSADAHFFRGEALAQAGDNQSAARAYLESFSGSPDARRAPEALYKLGLSLNALGQREEACLMLQEVGNRYPGSEQVGLASQSRVDLGCS